MFAIDDTEKHGYVVLALPAADSWPRRPAQMLGPGAQWWSLRDLRFGEVAVEPAEMLDLVEGYWDGWLPDGEVSLV
ncbi:hypothetical protein [Streptomyces sp. NPDC017988]|uniref:hypothetical protein n=1 Tax=Streptomyces sp. NPDC017988 TaxID=3365025 RepID=UPI0037A74107